MKAIINGIHFEGSPDEFKQFIGLDKAQVKSLEIDSSLKTVLTQPVSKDDQEDSLPGTIEFITALYRYKPSRNRNRQGYALKLLASGKTMTIRNLARRANADVDSVIAAIRRAVAADCVIQVNNRSSVASDDLNQDTKVRLVSPGTIERALAVKDQYHTNSELATKKISINKDSKIISTKSASITKVVPTGSAPITKILYNE